MHRMFPQFAAAAIVGVAVMFATGDQPHVRAYGAGSQSPTQSLVAVNYDLGFPIFATYLWVTDSSAIYSRGNPGGSDPYTRITHYTHSSHTTVSYGGVTFYASVVSYFYNGWGLNVTTLYNVFAGCLLPPWNIWLCGSGYVDLYVYPNPAQISWQGTMTSAPPWYPYSGTQYAGSYSFS